MKNGFIRKADILLAAVLLLLGLGSTALLYSPADNDARIVITIEGRPYKELSLYSETEFDIETEHGYNHVTVSGGTVCVDDADCKNHDCMGFGKISKEGQMIVCLPHKVMIQIKGGDGVDAVNY